MSANANGEGDVPQRKKRAWRKPREPITPTSEGSQPSPAKPVKLQRIRKGRGVVTSQYMGASPADVGRVGQNNKVGLPTSTESQSDESMIAETSADEPVNVKRSADIGSTSADIMGVASDMPGTGGGATEMVVDDHAPSLISIDGSIMEGGGQILRIATALSCILTRPLYITCIRAGRDKPGLRPQHLTGLQLLEQLCGGRLEGGGVGSDQVTFYPRAIEGGEFVADTKTAGSVGLLLQVSLPVLLFAKQPCSKVTLRGGTNADMAPPIDYLTQVFQPIAAKFGVAFDCHLKRRGFYPKGRGEVVVTCPHVKSLRAVEMLDPGELRRITLQAFTAGAVNRKVSRQMIQAARRVFQQYVSNENLRGVVFEEKDVQETDETAFGNSSGIIVVAETSTGCLLASSANGRKSEPSIQTGITAGEELVRNLRQGGCVDEHLQDQLIILMALAKGTSRIRTGALTLHTETAIHIATLMTNQQAKFHVEEVRNGGNIIHCEGIGLEQ